ncbi:hypothetical protein MRX96_020152 [Rhipicephalus microplus]
MLSLFVSRPTAAEEDGKGAGPPARLEDDGRGVVTCSPGWPRRAVHVVNAARIRVERLPYANSNNSPTVGNYNVTVRNNAPGQAKTGYPDRPCCRRCGRLHSARLRPASAPARAQTADSRHHAGPVYRSIDPYHAFEAYVCSAWAPDARHLTLSIAFDDLAIA